MRVRSRKYFLLLLMLVVLGAVHLRAYETEGSGLEILTALQEQVFNASMATSTQPTHDEVLLLTHGGRPGNPSQNPNQPQKPSSTPSEIIWSAGRSDRSGATIQDMLMCHAYAFHRGAKYGGACVRDWSLPQFQGKRELHEALLEAIGLSKVLKFKCPPKDSKTKTTDS